MEKNSPIVVERTVHILQMGKHFLYLPIYYAEHKKFFGHLPAGVEVIIDEPVAEHTDNATYDQMMDESPDYRDYVMAITDPAQILRTPLHAKRLPAVLATLVTNGAFWAINHGTHQISGLRDLGVFDRIIAYEKGTTSYNIAARIAHDSGKHTPLSEFIHIVAPGKELLLLSDPKAGANAIALSPDILRIEEMTCDENKEKTGKKTYSIDLPIGDTQEYNDVVVTTLVSSNDFVAENPEIVQGIVGGIQHALVLIHRSDPDVLRFARSYFHYSNRAQGALAKAIKAGVIPRQVSVAQPHWKSAAKASYESSNLHSTWTQTEEAKALEYFRTCIQPYENFTEIAVKLEIPQKSTNPPRAILATLGVFAAVFVAISITAYLGGLPAFIIAIGIFAGVGIFRLTQYIKQFKMPILGFLGLVGIILAAIPFVERWGFTEKKLEFFGLSAAFLLPAVLEALNYAEREKK